VNDSGVGSESDDLHPSSPTPNGASAHINDVGSAPGGGEGTSHHEYDRLRDAPSPPLLEAKSDDDAAAAGEAIGYTFWQIARTSLIFCPVWFAANYSYNKSLSLTSVSSNTILSSTSSTALVFSCVVEGWLTHHFLRACACVLAVRT
jgi:solute carrier family 35 protein F5